MISKLTLGCLLVFLVAQVFSKDKDMLRKSIVYDKNTPDVFYCPMQKPKGFDKMLVKARPLKKLCEYEGKGIPEGAKSDCYQDVDESDYACKEKYRIMMRLNPPGSDKPFDGNRLKRFLNVDTEYIQVLPNIDEEKNDKKAVFLPNRLG